MVSQEGGKGTANRTMEGRKKKFVWKIAGGVLGELGGGQKLKNT